MPAPTPALPATAPRDDRPTPLGEAAHVILEPLTMPAFIYPAQLDEAGPEDFIVTFRDVPEAITGASNVAEALQLAGDALSVAIGGYLDEGRVLPDATEQRSGDVMVPLSPGVVARVALEAEMERMGVSRRALAERMGKDEKHVRRILAGEASLDQAVSALRALGLRTEMRVAPLIAA